jgi:hypothetical protein
MLGFRFFYNNHYSIIPMFHLSSILTLCPLRYALCFLHSEPGYRILRHHIIRTLFKQNA